MSRKVKFEKGNFYHIFNRGVDKRKIFLDDFDRFRFVYDLFEFNDTRTSTNLSERIKIANLNNEPLFKKDRNLITNILAFSLMENHYHLVLKEIKQGGISEFLRKLSIGYTMLRYNRSGVLFQGRFKAVEIKDEPQFVWTIFYVHFNPIEIIEKNWKEKTIKNKFTVLNFLNNYRWSSHLDYLEKNNFPEVIQKEALPDFFPKDKLSYKKEAESWLFSLSRSDLEVGPRFDLK